ncbi:MAG: dihydrolipoyl dehydrogenase [Nitrospinaceae bacterium]
MSQENLLVLGAGPGGYAAAFLAADRGMAVTLVESGPRPGGVCLHRGCIPSKTLLHLAKLIHEVRDARQWGLTFGEPKIDLEAIRQWKNRVVDKMSGGLETLCKQRGVRFVQGRGVFKDSHTLEIADKETLTFGHCILAVGSRPALPKMFSEAGPRIMDSTSALEMEEIPGRLLIVGGGYIGLEMGTVYAALGSCVTVVEMTDGLLPGVDRDLVRPLRARLKNDFENIYLNTKVTSVCGENSGVRAVLEGEAGPREQNFDRVLVSVGRVPNSRGIGLENTRVELDERGYVQTDQRRKTADDAIHAIGDVIGGAMLAHKASAEARAVVEAVAGGAGEFDHRTIPAVVFTDPEIAWCGLTESEARAAGREVAVARFPWGASGRAQTLGRADGLTKMIIDPKSERILGAGLTGSGAGELIAEAVLAVEMGAVVQDLAGSIHPHPTLSETLMEAAESYHGQSPHLYKKPRK